MSDDVNLAIFDLDGTLTETNEVDTQCFVEAFRIEFGIDGIDTDWSRYRHATDSAIAKEIFRQALGRAPSAEEVSRVQDRLRIQLTEAHRADPGRFRPVAGAGQFLRDLTATGWKTCIATGAWSVSAQVKLHASGLGATGPLVCCDGLDDRESIVRSAIAKAAQIYGQNFGRTVLIGDGIWDLLAAQRLTLPFVGVASGDRAAELRAAGAIQLIPDYTDAERALAALREAPAPTPVDLPARSQRP